MKEVSLRSRLPAAWLLLSGLAPAQTEWVNVDLRSSHALARHPGGNGVILFGGRASSSDLGDTWVLSGAGWGELPKARTGTTADHAMAQFVDATDSTKVVRFGGRRGSLLDGQTWVFFGDKWSSVNPTSSPPARQRHAMVSAWGRAVLFGGEGPAGDLGDTWEWDGAANNNNGTWTPGPTGPTARSRHAMAFAANVSRVVLFGGQPLLDDTWEYDGTTWSQRSPVARPTGRDEHAMAYDPSTGTIVLFGGRGNSGPRGDTWTWNSATGTWTQRLPATSPPARRLHRMEYDTASGRVMLIGGLDGSDREIPDTWVWDGFANGGQGQWNRLNPPPAGDGRDGVMVFDHVAGESMLYDAVSGGTWHWNGARWIRRQPTNNPTVRVGCAMDWDPTYQRAIRYGGRDGQASYGDLFAWNGLNWQAISTTVPPGMNGCGMAYDTTRHRHVVFGGDRSVTGVDLRNETWEWDGDDVHAWTEVIPAQRPSPRYFCGMAFDPARARTLLFGGIQANSPFVLNDTWEWDGATWTQRSPAHSPPARWAHRMVYDEAQRRVVLFGGLTTRAASNPLESQNDVWEWDGTDWRDRSPALSPARRHAHQMAYDPIRARTVIYGGFDGQSSHQDTWEYGPIHPATAKIVPNSGCVVNRTLLVAGTVPWIGDRLDLSLVPPPPSTAALLFFDAAYVPYVDVNPARQCAFGMSAGSIILPFVPSITLPPQPDLVGAQLSLQALLITLPSFELGSSSALDLTIGTR